eukprot:9009219-Lingulodinium_polyedra.AAC.1
MGYPGVPATRPRAPPRRAGPVANCALQCSTERNAPTCPGRARLARGRNGPNSKPTAARADHFQTEKLHTRARLHWQPLLWHAL